MKYYCLLSLFIISFNASAQSFYRHEFGIGIFFNTINLNEQSMQETSFLNSKFYQQLCNNSIDLNTYNQYAYKREISSPKLYYTFYALNKIAIRTAYQYSSLEVGNYRNSYESSIFEQSLAYALQSKVFSVGSSYDFLK